MPDGCSHAADLAVASLDDSDLDPEIRDSFAEPDRGITRREVRLRVKEPHLGGEGWFSIQNHAISKTFQRVRGRFPLHKHEVGFFHVPPRSQEAGIPGRLVAQQEKALRVRIQTADWINPLWKSELCESAVCSHIRCELREHPERLVESQEHGR